MYVQANGYTVLYAYEGKSINLSNTVLICVYVGSTVVLQSIAVSGVRFIISAQV
jgi:hypothetical protein